MKNLPNARNIADAALIKTKPLPAAGAIAYTDAIDIDQDVGGTIENIAFAIECPAVPGLAATKRVTYRFQQSEDGETFANIPELAPCVQETVDAKDWRVRLPPTAHRYVRVSAEADAASGTLAADFSLYLLT